MNGPELLRESRHDRELVAQVAPGDWTNPRPEGRYHLVVIGAGTAGLVTAIVAAGLGARVAMIERRLMGGDQRGRRGRALSRCRGLCLPG